MKHATIMVFFPSRANLTPQLWLYEHPSGLCSLGIAKTTRIDWHYTTMNRMLIEGSHLSRQSMTKELVGKRGDSSLNLQLSLRLHTRVVRGLKGTVMNSRSDGISSSTHTSCKIHGSGCPTTTFCFVSCYLYSKNTPIARVANRTSGFIDERQFRIWIRRDKYCRDRTRKQ